MRSLKSGGLFDARFARHHPFEAQLKPILRAWVRLQEEYLLRAHELPYRFNERPNVGLLAAAAWRTGSTALEEYVTEKEHRREKGKSAGRADLRVVIGKRHFVIEAKVGHRAVITADTTSGWKRAWELLLESRLDVGRTEKGKHGVVRVGIVFWVPRVPAAGKGAKSALLEARARLIDDLRAGRPHNGAPYTPDFWAAYFPSVKKVERHRTDGDYFPGVILLGRTARAPRTWD